MDSKMYQFSHSLQTVAAIYAANKYLAYYKNTEQETVEPDLHEYQL